MINWSNVSDLMDVPALANQSTGGTFWVGILYMIWIIILLTLIYWGWEIAILSASFIGLILGLLLVYADLIGFRYVSVFIGIILIMFLYIMWSSPKAKQ